MNSILEEMLHVKGYVKDRILYFFLLSFQGRVGISPQWHINSIKLKMHFKKSILCNKKGPELD